MEKIDAIWHHPYMAGDSDKDEFPSDAADRFQVRMPPGMRDRLKEWASANGRSMNSEIVDRINRSFEMDEIVARTPEIHLQQQLSTAKLQHDLARADYEATKQILQRMEESVINSEATMQAVLQMLEQVRAEREATARPSGKPPDTRKK
ncbi:MAG: Arc family DNA-binding protein [Methylorubrum rhodinum]|uniref:Arc family DNA-binding protein n=1 Tax=Methylorubrum rhodinum TaxID=29428 RepID=UPI003BB0262B